MDGSISTTGRTARRRDDTKTTHFARISLLAVQALVAVTAIAGGTALILGALNPELATVLNPPIDYLAGTPFSSYLLPGIVLAVVVGGLHAVAFVLGIRRSDLDLVGAATAGVALLIWVFVQMIYIPFSFLQAVYVAFGLAEIGAIMLALGILRSPARTR